MHISPYRLHRQFSRSPRCVGFTILETIVSIAIVLMILALLLPAVQKAREAARRVQCSSNLRQIGLAIENYEAAMRMFPPGGDANGYSFHVAILPYMEQESLHRLINGMDFNLNPMVGNDAVRTSFVQNYVCPSDGAAVRNGVQAATNYAGNLGTGLQTYGYNGLFRHLVPWSSWQEGPVTPADVTDGLSNSAAVSEILVSDWSSQPLRVVWYTSGTNETPGGLEQFANACACGQYMQQNGKPLGSPVRGRPWLLGDSGNTLYNHVLTPNRPSCFNGNSVQTGAFTASSQHPGGVNLLYADCHIRFIPSTIDLAPWRALGSINGNP